MKNFFFIFFLLGLGFLYAQNYENIENKILSLEFNSADSAIKKLSPSLHQLYFLHHKIFYQQFFYENYQKELFFLKSDSLITQIKNMNGSEDWRNAFLGEIYLERAMIYYLQKSYWNAYRNFRESFKISQKTKNYKHLIYPKRLHALMDIFLGSIPSKYLWITEFLGYSGDINKGMVELQKIISKTEILRNENQVILFYLAKHLLNNHELAFEAIQPLHSKYPNNRFYAYLLGINYLDKKELIKAKHKFAFGVKNPITGFDYPLYHLAHCYLYELQLDSAQFFLEKFIEKKRGNIFKADANFKLGVILSIKNQKMEAQKYFYRATQFNEQISDKDMHAIKQSQNWIYKPLSSEEMILFQARWLFDGGNYDKALKILNMIHHSFNPDITIELHYRKARIYHETKDYENALKFYQKVLVSSTTKNLWMKPYSAYFSALIYNDKKDIPKVKFYLNKALSYKNYDFQASLEQKVKTMLLKIDYNK